MGGLAPNVRLKSQTQVDFEDVQRIELINVVLIDAADVISDQLLRGQLDLIHQDLDLRNGFAGQQGIQFCIPLRRQIIERQGERLKIAWLFAAVFRLRQWKGGQSQTRQQVLLSRQEGRRSLYDAHQTRHNAAG